MFQYNSAKEMKCFLDKKRSYVDTVAPLGLII